MAAGKIIAAARGGGAAAEQQQHNNNIELERFDMMSEEEKLEYLINAYKRSAGTGIKQDIEREIEETERIQLLEATRKDFLSEKEETKRKFDDDTDDGSDGVEDRKKKLKKVL